MVGRGRGGRGGCGGGGRSSGGTGRRSRPLAGGSRPRRTRTARGRARLHRLVGCPRPRSPHHDPQLPRLQPHAPQAATLLPRLAVRAALQRSTTTSLLLPRLSRHLATAAAIPQPPMAAAPPLVPQRSFYKRPLPPSCTAFASPEGKQLFAKALAAGTMESYFTLAVRPSPSRALDEQ